MSHRTDDEIARQVAQRYGYTSDDEIAEFRKTFAGQMCILNARVADLGRAITAHLLPPPPQPRPWWKRWRQRRP